MNAHPVTCQWGDALVLDLTEATLLAAWSRDLRHGHTPGAVLQDITTAVTSDPRLGLAMDACTRHGCNVLVDEDARTPDGALYCSDDHRDADVEDTFERYTATLLRDAHHDVHNWKV